MNVKKIQTEHLARMVVLMAASSVWLPWYLASQPWYTLSLYALGATLGGKLCLLHRPHREPSFRRLACWSTAGLLVVEVAVQLPLGHSYLWTAPFLFVCFAAFPGLLSPMGYKVLRQVTGVRFAAVLLGANTAMTGVYLMPVWFEVVSGESTTTSWITLIGSLSYLLLLIVGTGVALTVSRRHAAQPCGQLTSS